jgi:ABC-type nitrate/sulfonate/bicarbonate transport system substrate-binding protein
MRTIPNQQTNRRALLALVAIAALAQILPASAAEKLKLAQNQSPISGVSIVADRKGFFARNGLDVEVINFTTGKQCLDTVIGGRRRHRDDRRGADHRGRHVGPEDRVPGAH